MWVGVLLRVTNYLAQPARLDIMHHLQYMCQCTSTQAPAAHLAKLCDLRFQCQPLSGILHSIQVNRPLVSGVPEDVVGRLCRRSALLVPKDEICNDKGWKEGKLVRQRVEGKPTAERQVLKRQVVG